MTTYERLDDIPQFTQWPAYRINMPWDHIERWLGRNSEAGPVELDPDFQRGHVWTPEQQSRYIEFRLRGGQSGKDILWNSPTWNSRGGRGGIQLVDGLQRLTAVRGFMEGRIPAFGKFLSEYVDSPMMKRMTGPDFIFHVNDLPDRASVLRWYLELNSGGTPHSADELARVADLLKAEAADV
jgi:hypothetical protein